MRGCTSLFLIMWALAACHQQAPEDTRSTRASQSAAIEGNEAAGRLITPIGTTGDDEDLIGRQLDVEIDVGRRVNDVAFWVGTESDELLAVVGRDLRTADERAAGQPAARAMMLPASGRAVLRGTVERVPSAEVTYGWGLTRVDAERLADSGVYLRLHEVVQ